eukprot:TRINITY_DN69223_c0_g1_i1.p1 TRINITY_DN69223_c0_g1~~TRINITY_DN69223_c0_g1_i1.p1  ORF type:complete len:128 (-),score=17.59 TRINITY_DN69223_c0_g1_i1:27-410(-)
MSVNAKGAEPSQTQAARTINTSESCSSSLYSELAGSCQYASLFQKMERTSSNLSLRISASRPCKVRAVVGVPVALGIAAHVNFVGEIHQCRLLFIKPSVYPRTYKLYFDSYQDDASNASHVENLGIL